MSPTLNIPSVALCPNTRELQLHFVAGEGCFCVQTGDLQLFLSVRSPSYQLPLPLPEWLTLCTLTVFTTGWGGSQSLQEVPIDWQYQVINIQEEKLQLLPFVHNGHSFLNTHTCTPPTLSLGPKEDSSIPVKLTQGEGLPFPWVWVINPWPEPNNTSNAHSLGASVAPHTPFSHAEAEEISRERLANWFYHTFQRWRYGKPYASSMGELAETFHWQTEKEQIIKSLPNKTFLDSKY